MPVKKSKPKFAEFSRKLSPQPQPQPEPTPIVGTITPPKEKETKLRGGRLNAGATAADALAQGPASKNTQTATPALSAAVSVTQLPTQKPRLGNTKPASPPTPPAPSPGTPAPTNTQITANTETAPEPKTTEPPTYQQKPWENMLTSLALNALKKEGQEIIPGINHASFFQGRLSAFNYTDPTTGKDTIKIISNSSNDIIYQKCRGESPIVENINNSQKQYLSALYQHFSQQLEGSISR